MGRHIALVAFFPRVRLRVAVAAASLFAVAAPAARAQEPDFDLVARLDPDVVEVDGRARLSGVVVLSTADNDGQGAQGWSLSIAPAGQSVFTLATTAGTVGADRSAGGLRDTGFEKTELTQGAGNEGAVSAVVLSFVMPITLPQFGEATLLRVGLEVELPAGGCVQAGITFVDGLRGSGQPVDNKITWDGKTRRDDGGAHVDPTGAPFDNDGDAMTDATRLFCDEGAVRFRRGDCDSNAVFNLTDAIFALNHLFLAGPDPVCHKACDVTDDGAFNLTDPINLLNHLFLGGPEPPMPYPMCGVDETDDGLDCQSQLKCKA